MPNVFLSCGWPCEKPLFIRLYGQCGIFLRITVYYKMLCVRIKIMKQIRTQKSVKPAIVRRFYTFYDSFQNGTRNKELCRNKLCKLRRFLNRITPAYSKKPLFSTTVTGYFHTVANGYLYFHVSQYKQARSGSALERRDLP